MSDGLLPFPDTDYDKLQRAVFPTIRRRDKYGSVGDVNTITHGKEIGQAEIIAKETITLGELNNQFVKYDAQTETVEGAYKAINKFDKKRITSDEELTLYWNRWVDDEQ